MVRAKTLHLVSVVFTQRRKWLPSQFGKRHPLPLNHVQELAAESFKLVRSGLDWALVKHIGRKELFLLDMLAQGDTLEQTGDLSCRNEGRVSNTSLGFPFEEKPRQFVLSLFTRTDLVGVSFLARGFSRVLVRLLLPSRRSFVYFVLVFLPI